MCLVSTLVRLNSVMRGKIGDRLEKVLGSASGDMSSVRWEVDVPIITNPFILVDIAWFETATFAIIFVAASLPQAVYEGFTSISQIAAILRLCLLGVLIFAASFLIIGLVFLKNRYCTMFVLNEMHIYYEVAKAGKGAGLLLAVRPRNASDSRLPRSLGREIPWNRVDRFQTFPSMGTILLKRGFWEIVRLYTPDEATYIKVLAYIAGRVGHSS